MKIQAYFILLLSSLAFLPITIAAKPNSEEVKRELAKLVGKKRKPRQIRMRPVKPHSTGGLASLLALLQQPLTIIIIIVIVIALIWLIKRMAPYYGKDYSDQDQSGLADDLSDEYKELTTIEALYNKALELAKTGKFNHAVILLHKATVEFLKDKLIISKKGKYTNNDMKRLIRKNHKPISEPFSIISGGAEIAGFSEIQVNSDDFNTALIQFRNTFLRAK